MSEPFELSQTALYDFNSARRKAALQALVMRLSGRPSELLSYDEVRKKLRAVESNTQKLEVIPLDAIIGSVGRYSDFNRLFQPLSDSDQGRWIGVRRAISGLRGVPPIEVYRIGKAYFVKDGNHRVSVARELGFQEIEAYVTEVHAPVTISPELDPDELILRAEQAEFLDKTDLHKLRPESNLSVTVPGQYEILLEHIGVHQYYMGIDERRDVSYQEAVVHWYDEVYLPVIALIKERSLDSEFPKRTETDLYLWLAKYRAELNQELGWDLEAATITQHAAEAKGKSRLQLARELDPKTYSADDLLVAISGTEIGWQALEQAIFLAQKEHARIYAVHVLSDSRALVSDEVEKLKLEFARRTANTGLKAQLAIDIGQVVSIISERARWTDVVVANLAYPPGVRFRLSSGFQTFIRRIPKVIMAVPGVSSPLSKVLLAYNGSSKADMALFATATMGFRWKLPVVVVSIKEFAKDVNKILDKAKSYLDKHEVAATYLAAEGPVASTLIELIESENADVLAIGGYEYSALFEPILGGGVLDEVLRQTKVPMLICQ